MPCRSEIFAQLFFLDIESAVKLKSGRVLSASQLNFPVTFLLQVNINVVGSTFCPLLTLPVQYHAPQKIFGQIILDSLR